MNETNKPGNQPEKRFSTGAISATVFLNTGTSADGQETEFRTINIERSYKDKQDQWQKTSGFRVNDLHKVALVAQKAFEYLVLKDEVSS